MNIYLTAALEYLSLGWSVIPVARDKTPTVKWKEFQEHQPSQAQVQSWFAGESNLGACTGAVSGFVVIDADSEDAIKRLHNYLGGEPKTPCVKTPRGLHYYFLHPGVKCKNAVSIIPGVDFRGDGGYIVLPPSINEDGVIYEWATHPANCLMASLPDRVLQRVKPDAPKRGAKPASEIKTVPAPTDGTPYGRMALAEEIATLRATSAGQRNQMLNKCAFSLFQLCLGGELQKHVVETELTAAALDIGLTELEITKTLRSASGAAQPRSAPPSSLPASKEMIYRQPSGEAADDAPAPTEQINPDYVEKDGSLYHSKPNGEERILSLVSRATARIAGEIFMEDGDTTFSIEGETANNRRFNFEITAKDFSEDRTLKAAFMNAAGSDAYIRSGMSRHLAPAITYLSDNEQIDRRTRFKRTGWLNKSTFLMPGRDLGKDEIELEKDLPFYASKDAELKLGINALHELMQVQDPTLTTVAVTTLFSAAMSHHAGWQKNRTGMFIAGRTGSWKSAFVGCAMCLFGPDWINDQNWISWGDTVNAVMSIAIQCQDMPMFIDNYKPVIHAGARELVRLIHGIFEGGEKRRLNRNSERRQHRQTLTWPVITGEDVPDCDAATTARLLVVNFPLMDRVNANHLTAAQENSHHLAAVGTAWINWLATEEGQAAAKESGAKLHRIRSRYTQKLVDAVPGMVNVQRVATNLAVNFLTWETMGQCPALAEFVGDFQSYHDAGLDVVGIGMGERTRESLEANRFLDTLADTLAGGRHVLLNRWASMNTIGATVLGWQDEEYVYLLVKPCLKAVTEYLGKDGLGFLTERTLFKQLDDNGCIAAKGSKSTTKTVKCSESAYRVLVLHRAALFPDADNDDEETTD